MSRLSLTANPRGSLWHRWDPHIHAPGTLLADGFHHDWDKYLTHLESRTPTVRALGITDYFSINSNCEVRRRKSDGRLPNVDLIFPNVEMRLDIKTAKQRAINLHLLFSPEDPDHEQEIEAVLRQLSFRLESAERTFYCTPDDLLRLGRELNPSIKDERVATRAGAQQFKVDLSQLRNLFRSEGWLQKNCLIAVAGSSQDGTGGLGKDDSWQAARQNLEWLSHIIFASTPSQREFWLGRKEGTPPSLIEKHYRALKPCLHGSDAHRHDKTLKPDEDRYCWIKGDLTFEALRQAVLEPAERVWIGKQAPLDTSPSLRIDTIDVSDADWFANGSLELNPGLVAVIGERGSGKTALADIIARGAGALGSELGESSFLRRATEPTDLIKDAAISLKWGDGESTRTSMAPEDKAQTDELHINARYLSQQFVEKLCSSSGLAVALRKEIDQVIFEATSEEMRGDASSLAELRNRRLGAIQYRRSELRRIITESSEAIAQEDVLRDSLGEKIESRGKQSKDLKKAREELEKLVPKGQEKRAKDLDELQKIYGEVQQALQGLRRRKQELGDLRSEVAHIRSQSEPRRLADMRSRFENTGLSADEWKAFGMVFAGPVVQIVDQAESAVDNAIERTNEGDPDSPVDTSKPPTSDWPLVLLRQRRDQAQKAVGIDAQKQRRYDEVAKSIKRREASLGQLDREIEHAKGAKARREAHLKQRRQTYQEVFTSLDQEQTVLESLYGPLHQKLEIASGAMSKLRLFVHRTVDLDAWVEKGESLIDLRTAGELRGRGELRKHAAARLLGAWRSGSAERVAEAVDTFRKDFAHDLIMGRPGRIGPDDRRQWEQSVGAWLYSTEHVTLEYGMRYDGTPIENLSPGTRGIVLLLLYLAIDEHDRRPLIIDQPEENLDPKSIFKELVGLFRSARERRQVIVVTHNANLVVNTDADQVIVATAKQRKGVLPEITYETGSLENPNIRSKVCEILEGGERAFLERERRYRLRWEDITASPPEPEQ